MNELTLQADDGPVEVVTFAEDATPEEIVKAIEAQSSWTAHTAGGTITCIPPGPVTILGAVSYDRGHEMRWDDDLGWVYKDTGATRGERSCIRCGEPPTPEGYDACRGHIEGAQYACCGHGVYEPSIIYKKVRQLHTGENN